MNDLLTLPQIPSQVRLQDYLGLWMIEPTHARAVWSRVKSMDLAAHIQGGLRWNSDDRRLTYMQRAEVGGVTLAFIHASGSLMKHESSFEESTSTLILRQDWRKAAADSSIDAIVFVGDSPGGTCAGTSDLADDIARATRMKPTLALVEDLCASAMYWLASQCTRIIATNETALIGSIGTLIGIYDMSKMAEQEGIEALVFATGDLKGSGFPGSQITDEQRVYFQDIVDKTQRSFDAAVSSGRGLTPEQLASVKSGRVWPADQALDLKLIDGIARFDDAVQSFAETILESRTAKDPNMSDSTTPAASLSQLKAACPGADSDFLLKQVEAGASAEAAQTAWIETLTARIESRDDDIKKLKAEHETALKAEQEKTADLEQKLETVKAGVNADESPDADADADQTGKPRTLADMVTLN